MAPRFNPLGGFVVDAPLLPEALEKAIAFARTLPKRPGGFAWLRLYLHWTVSGFCALFPDYNYEVRKNPTTGLWEFVQTHNPLDNLNGYNNNAPASHTFHRNTGAIGISVTGMDGSGVGVHNFGSDAINVHEIEHLCAVAALLCITYGLNSGGTVAAPGEVHRDDKGGLRNTTGEPIIATHGECAVWDLYPTERIDLCSLVPLPAGVELTPAIRTATADGLRARIHVYAVELKARLGV